jgi:hypothetical protein
VSSPAETLTSSLAALGVAADVECDGHLAILRPRGSESAARQPWTAEVRAAVVDAARRCGFTHVALELSSS